MSSSQLLRLSGLAAVVGGVLMAGAEGVESVVYPMGAEPISQRVAHAGLRLIELTSWVYSFLLFVGLIGLHVHQSERVGRLGLVMFVATLVALALNLGALWSAVLLMQDLASVAPEWLDGLLTDASPFVATGLMVSFFLSGVAWFFYALVSFRARVYPRAASVMVAIGFLTLPFVPVAPAVLAGGGIAWMGWTVWRRP